MSHAGTGTPADDRPILVALGTSLGDRLQQLTDAVTHLTRAKGVRVVRVSAVYDTAPVGGVATERFLNAAVELTTELSPLALLDTLQTIEAALGRTRWQRWEDRTIDLDLVFWGRRVVELPRLRIPHPELHRRRFVLQPLVDVAPDALHPTLGKTLQELLEALPEEADSCIRQPEKILTGAPNR
ncbi:MAG: 2-amino-4-hydroxy-6-hydroxymethyldihydropteridine diphosphokinase [bacterium]